MTEGRSEEDKSDLYRGGQYARPERAVDSTVEPLRRLADRSLLARIGPLASGDCVLDVGAGDGRLVALLRHHGYEAIGVEPFAEQAAVPGLAPVALEDASLPPASADVVVLWHVLEHLDDPGRALDLVAPALKDGGRLVIAVPRLDSLQARIGADRWFHLDVPRHAVHFSAEGLRRLLERKGFTVIRTSGRVPDQNLLGMTQTLLNRVTGERNAGFRLLKGDQAVSRGDAIVTVVAAAPALVLALPLEALATATGQAGTLVVHARRSGS